ncbi:protein artichoke [Sitodiplosis mosellana]|uniref:protein artichoke n=1 Tax=Sitodiplosis mosellana TaxID=263140 RepID=UPI002443DFD3|nr:protein artichoke [Sitodiplosis mosellana]
MGSLVYTVMSMVQVASLHCSMRPEISPCSCAPHESLNNTIHVTCEGLASFNQVFDSLQNKFSTKDNIWLKVTKSQLDDLETRNFKDMNMNITKLSLNYDELRTLPESSFRNLSNLGTFSLSDNHLEEIPRHIFLHMPKIVTMDLGHGRIRTIFTDDFRSLNEIRYLILVNNNIRLVEKESIPRTLRFLHLGRNNLTSLNGTLRDNAHMEVLFLNENNLTSLDGELPIKSTFFKSLIVHHNKLQHLPQDLTMFMYLDAVYISDNELKSLNGVFRNASLMQTLSAHNNKIEYLAEDEFLYTTDLQELDVANNFIRAINDSLLTLKKVRICNFSRNHVDELSLNEFRGLRELQVVDLSYNRIERLTGRLKNVVDQDLYFIELRLDNNLLKTLDGAMMNLNRLKTLDVSYNKLKWISREDLIGLDDLESLDISHNYLQTLEETSMTFLPKLEKLFCSYNNLSKLERDFHGLPGLCFADLSNNHITQISPELVSKTRCNSHGVINKLEILLQENPILCMDELSKLFAVMEAQETRLLGIAHCIVPKEEEIPIIEPLFVPPSAPLTPQVVVEDKSISEMPAQLTKIIEKPQDELQFNGVMVAPNDVPSLILSSLMKSAAVSITDQPIKEIILTTTETPMPNPDENNIDIITRTEPSIELIESSVLTTVPDTVPLIAENVTVHNKLENLTVLETTPSPNPKSFILQTTETPEISKLSTSPSIAEIILGESESVSKSPEPDNYIYETFSPISPVNTGAISSLQRNEHLVLPEEPPAA